LRAGGKRVIGSTHHTHLIFGQVLKTQLRVERKLRTNTEVHPALNDPTLHLLSRVILHRYLNLGVFVGKVHEHRRQPLTGIGRNRRQRDLPNSALRAVDQRLFDALVMINKRFNLRIVLTAKRCELGMSARFK